MMISLYLSLICTFAPTKWQWDSSSNPYEPYDPIWTDYYPLDSDAIEKGFQYGLVNVPLSIGSYHVDLADMKQRSNDLQRNRRVRRVEVGHHPKSINAAEERVANKERERVTKDREYFEACCAKHMPYANDERLRKCAEEMLNEFLSSTNAQDVQSLPQQFYLGDKDDLVFQNDLRAPKANDHKDPLYDWYNDTIEIHIWHISGHKTHTLKVHFSQDIASVKVDLEYKSGIPATIMNLIFAGKQLMDHKTLADYDIRNEAFLHLWERTNPLGDYRYRDSRETRNTKNK